MNYKSILTFATIIFIITPTMGVLAETVVNEEVIIPASYFQRYEFTIDQDNTPLTTTVTVTEGNGVDLFILSMLWPVPDATWVNYIGERVAPFNNETYYALNGTSQLVRLPSLLDSQVEFLTHNITQGNSAEFTVELNEGAYFLYLWNRDFDFIIGTSSDSASCIEQPIHPVYDCVTRYGGPTTVIVESVIDNPRNILTIFLFLGGFVAVIVFVIWRVKRALLSPS